MGASFRWDLTSPACDRVSSRLAVALHCHTRGMPLPVSALARDLGVDSRTVLGVLKDLGVYASSASSLLDEQTVRVVQAKIGGHPVEQVRPEHPSRSAHATAKPENPFRGPVRATNPPRRTVTRVDPDEQFTAEELGKLLRIRPATVRKWASRGYLAAVDQWGRSRLYRYGDAVQVRDEARTRRRRASKSPPIPLLQWQKVRPVTASEAARLAGVSPSTIRTWVRRGHLTPLHADVRPMTFGARSVVGLADRQYDKRLSH